MIDWFDVFNIECCVVNYIFVIVFYDSFVMMNLCFGIFMWYKFYILGYFYVFYRSCMVCFVIC